MRFEVSTVIGIPNLTCLSVTAAQALTTAPKEMPQRMMRSASTAGKVLMCVIISEMSSAY